MLGKRIFQCIGEFEMSKSFLQPDGVYDPRLRFAFTNITTEDFTSYWDGNPITIKPGQTVELSHHLAVKFTNEMVDRIIIEAMKVEEQEWYHSNPGAFPNSWPKRGISNLGIPTVRQEWANKIVRQLSIDEESPEIQMIRAQIREELKRDMSAEKSTEPIPVPTSEEDFAIIKNETEEAPKPKKAPLKIKTLKDK